MKAARRLDRRWVIPLGERSAPPPGPAPPGLLAPKGHLTRADRWVLAVLAVAPLASVAIRVLALPGIVGDGLGWLRLVGDALNDTLSLGAIAADQREHVLYLLFLPTCALLVALARLTFGLRVLGFRSILISVAFRQSGLVPSLLMIAVAVGTIVLVRPWLRKIRLPYYGRVSVILCIVALTLVGPLIAGPWLIPGVLWGAATFPVIVLGMLAEGIARTLDRDNVVTASWRAITTILLAFVSALVCWAPALQDLLLQFPELVLAQIAGIVLVSQYLDLRLLRDWDRRVARRLLGRAGDREATSRVAVVRDGPGPGEADGAGPRRARAGAPRSVQRIVDALRGGGHTVKVLEGDPGLVRELRRFFPADSLPGDPRGIVLHLADGLAGEAGGARVAAALELSGIPYVGPTPLGHAVASDRAVSRVLLQQASVPVPPFRVMARAEEEPGPLRFPLLVRPRRGPGSQGKTVADPRALRAAVARITRRGGEALVEERNAGRRVAVCLIGNGALECLPLVELDGARREKICPAPIAEPLANEARRAARAAFRACGCRDYARVDLVVPASGEVRVLEVRTRGILARRGSFARAGLAAGYPFERLIGRIVEVARARYRDRAESPGARAPTDERAALGRSRRADRPARRPLPVAAP